MPRSKVRRTTKVSMLPKTDRERLVGNFENLAQKGREALINCHRLLLEKGNEDFQMFLEMYRLDLDKTMAQLQIDACKENAVPRLRSNSSTSSSMKDDGYVTDGQSIQKFKTPRRRSRSCTTAKVKSSTASERSQRNHSSSISLMGQPRSCRSRYRTPMAKRVPGGPEYPQITPKVLPNAPMTVLRRPRQGETVVSLSGSPLLVNSMNVASDKANCNIPLSDGTVLSLLPSKLRGMDLQLPLDQMRPEIKTDIRILQENLTAYIKKYRI